MPRYFSSISSSVDEIFFAAVAPVDASLLVQIFGEGFGQAIGQGFGHDRVVIVVIFFVVRGQFVAAQAGGDGEGAEIIVAAAFGRGDEIGQREEFGLPLAFPLLPQEMEGGQFMLAGFVGVKRHVVADARPPARSHTRRGRSAVSC